MSYWSSVLIDRYRELTKQCGLPHPRSIHLSRHANAARSTYTNMQTPLDPSVQTCKHRLHPPIQPCKRRPSIYPDMQTPLIQLNRFLQSHIVMVRDENQSKYCMIENGHSFQQHFWRVLHIQYIHIGTVDVLYHSQQSVCRQTWCSTQKGTIHYTKLHILLRVFKYTKDDYSMI